MRRIGVGVVLLLSLACTRREQRFGANGAEPAASAAAPEAAAPSPAGSAAFAERSAERARLVRETMAERGITDARVLRAMGRVPRHRFVPPEVAGAAYSDRPLPIGWGQTISQPYIVAAMTEAVAPQATDRCLEIGTGSGYQAAVLAELCRETYSIEYVPELAELGAKNLRALGYRVSLRTGDGYRGWPEAAPFDVVVVTAAPERTPPPLLDQLAVGGRLVIPVGPRDGVQKLILYTRKTPGRGEPHFERRELAVVRFVPFVGEAEAP